MLKLKDNNLAANIKEVVAKNNSSAIIDSEGKWVGVVLSRTEYQLLRAAAELSTDMNELQYSIHENKVFQLGSESQEIKLGFDESYDVISIEELFCEPDLKQGFK